MAEIKIDFDKKIGRMKPMHGVGQPPWVNLDPSHFHWLADAGIPYSRLHDVGGAYGRNQFVDIPNIFRDFNADENAPESYDFTFTDILIKGLMQYDCQPIFRLGVTIENHFWIHRLRTDPPADFDKWARICEHIIRHYNEGWADGFHFGIKYWEIWNEPDNDNGTDVNENPMWNGTMEDYFKLYEAASKHLKNCFGGNINVGGYASCGFWALLDNFGGIGETRSKYFVTFFEKFFAYVKENNCPIDFFSWHSYASTAETEIMADFIDEKLYEYGYAGLETHLNEWNNAHSRKYHGSVTSAARYAAMMCAQQNKKTYMLNFYDARIGIGDYAGMFSPLTYEPYVCYQSFKAFNELYKLGDQVKLTHDADGLYAIAASNGSDRAVLIANETENSCELTLPACKGMSVYTIDEDHSLEKSDADPTRLTVYKESVILLK